MDILEWFVRLKMRFDAEANFIVDAAVHMKEDMKKANHFFGWEKLSEI